MDDCCIGAGGAGIGCRRLLTGLRKAIVGAGSGGRADLGRTKDDIGCLFVVAGVGVIVIVGIGVVLGGRI